jgi:uncharacterized protein (TIGR00661 family)
MTEQRILYAIQATGNGHLARAQEVLPFLRNHANVDVLISGTQSDLKLPIEPDFRLEGLSYTFGAHGGIDFRDTFIKTILPQLKLRALQELLTIPIENYSWILHDFEPITAWRARMAGVPSAQLSHQAAFLSSETPRATPCSMLTEMVFRWAAPSNEHIGLHYQEYDQNITTPIIRRAIRELEPRNDGHYVVYLPSFSDEVLVPLLKMFSHTEWYVFNRHHQESYTEANVTVLPVSERNFLPLFESCEGILSGAGFQATSEAIFLGKKLLAVPQRYQYEQKSNAEALKRLGVPTLNTLDESALTKIADWIEHSIPLQISFPDQTEDLIRDLAARMENSTGHLHKRRLPKAA